MKLNFLPSIDDCTESDWDQLAGAHYPFLRHRFLHALETSRSATTETGWKPHHLLAEENGSLTAALPLYLKSHSWGEYVFDWSWADAYHQHRFEYYPKFVTAIPFTPVTGPRVGLGNKPVTPDTARILFEGVKQQANIHSTSGWHVLFPEADFASALEAAGMMRRTGVQYHWLNQGYGDFDDFLERFASRKRKRIRRERRIVAEQGLIIRKLSGAEITPALWDFFYRLYQRTYAKRNGSGGYLTRAFFQQLGKLLPENLLLVVAEKDDSPIAASLFFHDSDTLYGRYWGCLQEYDCLHFELCYYQGIDYAISHGLQKFDAGAQGEHKIQRGFEPVETHSMHWIKEPQFAAAIGRFLAQETAHIRAYIEHARGTLPYRISDNP